MQASDETAYATIKNEMQAIQSLSGKGVTSIEVLSPSDATPTGSAVFVVRSSAAVFLEIKGRVNLDEEIKKAQTKLKKAKDGAAKQQKVLGDKDFLDKVSSGVLETEKIKLEEFQAQERNYERSIEQFQQLKLDG